MNENLIGLENFIYNITENRYEFTTSNSSDTYGGENGCIISPLNFYNTSFGLATAVPEWEALTTTIILAIVIFGTIFGNILVVLGVFTHSPLRIVQNFFIVSLAVADLAVALLVMPLNVAYSTLGRWLWGKHLCKMWLTCDIMCCTSSILNLCAIALDRYWAITDPINYANKRSVKRVLLQIAGVWILSLIISSPPLFGWNDWPEEFTSETPCQLTSEPSYVVYSSFGSFFIPLFIMSIVYVRIYNAAKQRFRRRTLAARVYKRKSTVQIENPDQDCQQGAKEDSEDDSASVSSESLRRCQRKAFNDIKRHFFVPLLLLNDRLSRQTIESGGALTETEVVLENYKNNSLNKVSKKGKAREKSLLANVNKSGGVVHQFIEQKQKISLSKERRASRILGIIMGVFVICWLPFFLMYVMLPFCPFCCVSSKLINFITWLGYINSTVNPLIYPSDRFVADFRSQLPYENLYSRSGAGSEMRLSFTVS